MGAPRKLWLALAVVLPLAAAGSWLVYQKGGRSAPPPPAPARKPPVPKEVTLPARIRAEHVVSIATPVGGAVEAFFAGVGEEVFEGQLLARLSNLGLETAHELAARAAENAQERVTKIEAGIISARLEASRARADAQRARMDFDRAEKAYRRQKMLHGEGATPRRVFEKSEREFAVAETEFQSLETLARQAEERIQSLLAELQTAKKILEDKNQQLEDAQHTLQSAEIHAPVTGLVMARNGEVGREHPQGAELFQVAIDFSRLEAVMEAEPSLLAHVRPGDPALVLATEVQDAGLPGTVKEVRDNQAIIAFTSPNPYVRPGMIAHVRVRLN
jgi:multidrug efflux pump subunit AcrA (membrane-fusion protein)